MPARTGRDERSDGDLLRAHADGDPDAFGEVVHRHRDRLWAVALRTLGDREEAADAVQDALVSAFRAGGPGGSGTAAAFRGESAVTTWLHRIVVNACLDRVRRRAVRAADPLPDHDLADRGPDPVASTETALDVTAALATLPVEQRAALVLVDMYGWTVQEAARVLDCAEGTVKSRCARGRARLLPLLRVPDDGVDSALEGAADHSSGNQRPQGSVTPQTSSTTDTTARTPKGGDQR